MSVKRVKRLDFNKLRESEITKQGYLKAPATFTKVGVFTYLRGNGDIVREFRPPEEVLKAESLRTLEGVPVTNEHPEEMLTSENTEKYQVGFTGDSIEVVDDLYVDGKITITKKDAIDDVKMGKVELSCGYDADLEETPGVWEGEAYDVVQRNIVYNHVSTVDRGRAGPNVRLRLDSADAVLIEGEHKPNEEDQMEKITINGQEFEVSPELKAVLEQMMADKSTTDEQMQAYKDEIAALKEKKGDEGDLNDDKPKGDEEGEEKEMIDTMQAKIDALEEKLQAQGDFEERLQTRRKIDRVASKVLSTEKLDSLKGDVEIMKACLEENTGKKFDDKSDTYIQARFDMLEEELVEKSKKQTETTKVFENHFDNADTGSAKEARERMIKESREAWKKK